MNKKATKMLVDLFTELPDLLLALCRYAGTVAQWERDQGHEERANRIQADADSARAWAERLVEEGPKR